MLALFFTVLLPLPWLLLLYFLSNFWFCFYSQLTLPPATFRIFSPQLTLSYSVSLHISLCKASCSSTLLYRTNKAYRLTHGTDTFELRLSIFLLLNFNLSFTLYSLSLSCPLPLESLNYSYTERLRSSLDVYADSITHLKQRTHM